MKSPPAPPGSLAERWEDPEKLLRELAILRPEEIDVEAIAEYVDATIVYDFQRGCEASIVGRRDRAIITVNRSSPRERQRLAAAHELAHWLLDRGAAGFAPANPWGEELVEWLNQDGEVEEVSLEHRAEEWARMLLLPESMLQDDLPDETPITFATARGLARRYRTELLPAAMRLVDVTIYGAALYRSRPGERPECLRRNDVVFETWLRKEPGPETVVSALLNGSREAPGPTRVPSDAWLDFEPSWWCMAVEDSFVEEDGSVLTLLWWPGQTLRVMFDSWPLRQAAKEPGEEAVAQLVRSLEGKWGYSRVDGAGGELVLETRKPKRRRLVVPGEDGWDAEGLRGLVEEAARQLGVDGDAVLYWMLDFYEGY